MRIETSITITPERKKRIIEASIELHCSVSDILGALMRKTRVAFRNNQASIHKAVKYQRKSPVIKYLIWHVSFEPLCYEYGVSERLIFKVSVSQIYRVAIDMFLDELIQNGLNARVSKDDISTSYLKANYEIKYSDGIDEELWVILWDRRISKRVKTNPKVKKGAQDKVLDKKNKKG